MSFLKKLEPPDKWKLPVIVILGLFAGIVAGRMPGFLRIMANGNNLREAEYVLKRLGVGFDNLR